MMTSTSTSVGDPGYVAITPSTRRSSFPYILDCWLISSAQACCFYYVLRVSSELISCLAETTAKEFLPALWRKCSSP